MKVAVAGATGYLGRRLCTALLRDRHAVTAVVRPASDVTALPPDLDIRRAPAWESAALAPLLADADAVVDLVGVQGGDEVAPAELWAGNHAATVALAHGAGPERRFVLVSSVRVYGTGHRAPITERTPPRPDTEYGRAKLAAERAAQELAGGRAVILRVSEVYGPGDRRSMLYRLLLLLRRRTPVWIGDGRNVVHPCYVDDAIAALVLALTAPAGVALVAGAEAAPLRRILALGAEALGVPAPRWWVPAAVARAAARAGALARAAGVPFPLTPSRVAMLCDHRSYDLTGARAALGYTPRVALAEGLGHMVRALDRTPPA